MGLTDKEKEMLEESITGLLELKFPNNAEEVTEFCTDVVKSIALAVERYCMARGIE